MNTFLKISILLFHLVIALNAFGQQNPKDSLVSEWTKKTLIYEVKLPKIINDHFAETTITIKKAKGIPTLLKFESGGTITEINIDEGYSIKNNYTYRNYYPLKSISFEYGEICLLDISTIRAGIYTVNYSSCNFGGSYKLILTN
jgi:hypothetical protein